MTQNSAANPFASPVLVFTIGPKRATFNIHEALLQLKTSFFDIHPIRNGEDTEIANNEAETDPAFKSESSPIADTEMSEANTGLPTPSLSTTAAESAAPPTSPDRTEPHKVTVDYHLDTHFVRAFAIFVDWLYNVAPNNPETPNQCKTLIQAYLLALKYRAKGLQNLLLDRIRSYHIEHQVDFDLFFIYLLNRHGDDADCKLIQYFTDQIAYEIADTSIEDFDSGNAGFDHFLRGRSQGNVRVALVHALGKLATSGKNGKKVVDPAKAQVHDYYV